MGKEPNSMTISRASMDLEVLRATNAHHSARGGVERPNTTSPACSSVRSAAGSACVCLQGIMGTKLCALATTTGRPRREDPSALKVFTFTFTFTSIIDTLTTFSLLNNPSLPSLCPLTFIIYTLL